MTHRRAHRARPIFPRARLHAKLAAALRAPVALILGEPGFGRTTLIGEHLAQRGVRHARVAARPNHAEPAELGAAIARAAGVPAPAALSSEGVSRWLRDELAASCGVLVLDDCDALLHAPRGSGLLAQLVDGTSGALRWVLIGRDAGDLPVPRWLSSGIAELPLETDDLRVEPGELRDAARRLAPSDEALRTLLATTGGWPLGVSVALAQERIDAPPGPDEVYAFLLDAALEPLAPHEHAHVLELAWCGEFDGAVLDALECPRRIAEALVAAGVAESTAPGAYVFPGPVRAELRARCAALEASERATVLDRAAAALRHVGRWTDAVDLRVAAGDERALLETLERDGFSALDRGGAQSVRDALATLSDEVMMRHPSVLAMRAAVASLDESFDVSEAWFQLALNAASPRERRDVVIRYAMDLVRRGRSDAVELLETEAAREDAPTNEDADAALWALLGTAYVAAHRLSDARAAARRALVHLPAMTDGALRARVLHQSSYVALNDGDWNAARAHAERALERAEAASLHDLAARALSVLLNVAMLHDDDVPAARALLARIDHAGRLAANDGLRIYAILNAYSLEVDAGNARALEDLDAELHDMKLLVTPTVAEALLPAQALRATWDGRFAHAYGLLAPGVENLFDEDRTAYRWAEIALYAAAAGMRNESRLAAERCSGTLAHVDGTQSLALRALAYLALAARLCDDGVRAEEHLARALGSAPVPARMAALLAAVAAFCAWRDDGDAKLFALEDAIAALDALDLGGVGRLIEMLPLPETDLASALPEGVGR